MQALEMPALRKGGDSLHSHNNVVQDAHVNQCQGAFQSASNLNISLAWFRITGRVVMHKNDCCSIQQESFFHDLPGVNGCPVDRTLEHDLKLDDLVSGIQEERPEQLLLLSCKKILQVLFSRLGTGDLYPRRKLSCANGLRHRDDGFLGNKGL